MASNRYILTKGGRPIRTTSINEWERWMRSHAGRFTQIDMNERGERVTTSFQGVDMKERGDTNSMVWKTILTHPEREAVIYSATQEEALEAHAKLLGSEPVVTPEPVLVESEVPGPDVSVVSWGDLERIGRGYEEEEEERTGEDTTGEEE